MAKIPLVLLLQVNENASRNLWLLHSLLVLADGHPCNVQNKFIFCDKIVTFTFFSVGNGPESADVYEDFEQFNGVSSVHERLRVV